ncbi:hypothetical protein ABMA28_015876 [Loxostege sticticalis]|uniref:Mab-21-like cell fate specification n=1 Tax=Loxostege sticticalis TaxID=481309 RepID=A0ABD0TD97_LOXSC
MTNDGAWIRGVAGVAGIPALIGGGLYYLARGRAQHQVNQPVSSADPDPDTARNPNTATGSQGPADREDDSNKTIASSSELMDKEKMADDKRGISQIRGSRDNSSPDPKITDFPTLISDINMRYIAPRYDNFELHYEIFDKIFHRLHLYMKNVDRYYMHYSSPVTFSESQNDHLLIRNPDELDMDIVIGLPLNISDDPNVPSERDIKFEPQDADFVDLKMGIDDQKLFSGVDFMINKTAYKWRDGDDYLSSSKFLDWFESVVVRALNMFETNARGVPVFQVDGSTYSINRTGSGSAVTLTIENESSDLRMDVNLVPALRFPETRWPLNKYYRQIPETCKRGYWLIVPKPNEEASSEVGRRRSWRLAMHYQERELMHHCVNLRQAVRLLKKLCDSQKMDKISSYCIETLFLWEMQKRSSSFRNFWRVSPANLFKIMVQKLCWALRSRRIDYYWNEYNDLLAGVRMTDLALYDIKLGNLLELFKEEPDKENFKSVAKSLLTPEEFEDYLTKTLDRIVQGKKGNIVKKPNIYSYEVCTIVTDQSGKPTFRPLYGYK